LDGGKPKPISPEGGTLFAVFISPDGKQVVGSAPDGKPTLFFVEGGEPRVVPAVTPDDRIVGFTGDGHSVYVQNLAGLPTILSQVDLASGKRTLWKQFTPADPAGVDSLANFIITPDGKSYVYSFSRTLSDLYLVDGLR
jgi:hypothetical protein